MSLVHSCLYQEMRPLISRIVPGINAHLLSSQLALRQAPVNDNRNTHVQTYQTHWKEDKMSSFKASASFFPPPLLACSRPEGQITRSPIDLCSDLHLWSWAVGTDGEEESSHQMLDPSPLILRGRLKSSDIGEAPPGHLPGEGFQACPVGRKSQDGPRTHWGITSPV